MAENISRFQRVKELLTNAVQKIPPLAGRILNSPTFRKIAEFLKWQNLRVRLTEAKELIVAFTKEQPKTASFIYVCLFCAFSIGFLDEPCAAAVQKTAGNSFLSLLVALNPSGWWFFILIALWLVYMAIAGLSLTTEVFEKNLVKARDVLFVLLTLSLSSLVTLFLNILLGRYTPDFLETMNISGFSALRFRLSETSFPSFEVQSIWAVAMAVAVYQPRFKHLFFGIAAVISIAAVSTAHCFISDAVMGAYIGIMMYFVAKWLVSENRENFPLISF